MLGGSHPVTLKSREGKWIVATTVLGTGVAMINGTDVSVALPAIDQDLGAGVAGLQWILNGYMLTLASLILVGGSLGDRYGRRRVYVIGVSWFAVASVACGVAPSVGWLIGARILQGIGAALLTPGSLALIQSCFVPDDRSAAIGAWSGLTGIAAALGPFLGGALVDSAGWRWIFVLPVPLAVAAIWAAIRHVPESFGVESGDLDLPGALLAIAALGGISYAVISLPEAGVSTGTILAASAGGVLTLLFVLRERSADSPMLPFDVFSSAQFTAANLITFVVYGALGGVFFLLVVHLQTVLGYSAMVAGASTVPITALLLVGSPSVGRLAQRIGPRIPLTVGPGLLAVGMLMMGAIGPEAGYLPAVLPALLVFGVGLTITVTPVTATVLAAVDDSHSGLASGINNAVARTAQLLAVAALPAAAGLSGGDFTDPAAFQAGFSVAMAVAAGLAAIGAVVAWTRIRPDVLADAEPAAVECRHCGVEAPPSLAPSE